MDNMMNWFKENCRLLTFFAVVLASIGIYGWHCNNKQSAFDNCNNMIIEHYDAQISKTNKELKNIVKYTPEKRPTKIDSLYADLQAQYQKSLKDQKLFDESVKSMLELEFNKIQSEYETQEIWVGLITIVFLIFSFYSMMKSEQLEQQCREDVKRIHKLTENCEAIVASIETDKTTKLKNIEESYNSWKTSTEDKLKNQTTSLVSRELEAFRKERAVKMEEIAVKWNEEVGKKSDEVVNGINKRIDKITADYAKKTEEVISLKEKKLNEEIQRLLDVSEAKLKKLDIDKKIEAYLEAHTAIEDDIDKLFDGSFNTGGTMADASTNVNSAGPTQVNNNEDEK